MVERTLSRADDMSKRSYKSKVAYARDLAMLSPEAMFSDAREHASSYPHAERASHLLGGRPDLAKRTIARYMSKVEEPIKSLILKLAQAVMVLPKASKEDCIDTLRLLAGDHSLSNALGPVLPDCIGYAPDEVAKCAKETTSSADFDKCVAAAPAPSASAGPPPATGKH